MRKVLIITYYWPPSGGSGVQRWLKFTKHLPDFGWSPIIFTPENPSFEVKDQSLLKDISTEVEVIKLPIWEPLHLVSKIKGKGKQQSDLVKKDGKSLMDKLMLWTRGNLFIPDPRKYWVRPAVEMLKDIIVSNSVDVIITTGPPHSMHLIGLRLKRELGVKWLADFRDPWTRWDLLDTFYLTRWALKRHRNLERKVLKNADSLITVSNHYGKDFEQLSERDVAVITNGYEKEDFESYKDIKPEKDFVIRHVGLVDELRDPSPFLEAFHELLLESEEWRDVRIEFIGNVNQAFKTMVADNPHLRQQVSFKPYVPHKEVLMLYKKSSVLLLVLAHSQNAQGNIPGKLFEYLAAERPILGIGDPMGDSASIIAGSNAGKVCDPTDKESMKEALTLLFQRSGVGFDLSDIERYSRRKLTEQLATKLNDLIEPEC
ncbi:glycosyltransferase family 4 protein [Fulvivirga sp. M361]|uniref:glycosyltransferase family 4 protein n=1 Tax=Fulvivirga sp. M361 TaxID=2594266 RepID=UPI00117B922C|nr:glycosyltransferase family 4 protein [Fulvivirga sp. M361]TRX62141.1 glycosyltransferase family 4 protein [Fulvivirga sp. M361]